MTFKIPKGQEVTSFDFDVYDAETGDPVSEWDLMRELGGYPQLVDDFVFSEQGFLYLTDSTGSWFTVPRDGKYIIQFHIEGCEPSCPYMRY